MYIGIVEGDREGFVNTSGDLFQIISSSDFIIVVAGRSLGPKGSRGNAKEKYMRSHRSKKMGARRRGLRDLHKRQALIRRRAVGAKLILR